MEATAPWWGTAVLTLAGSALGVLATIGVSLLNRRTEQRRLSRAERQQAYFALLAAADLVWRLRAWPLRPEAPDAALAGLREAVVRVDFFADAKVADAAGGLFAAADEVVRLIKETRRESTPGRNDEVDLRFREEVETSRRTLREKTNQFVAAARRSLEIPGRYQPLSLDAGGGEGI